MRALESREGYRRGELVALDFCFRIKDRNEEQYERMKCRGYEKAMEDGGINEDG